MHKLKYLFLLICLVPAISWGACTGSSPTWETTPDYTSVAACIAGATAEDTINVTAGDGTEDWGTQLAITKGINLIGPGKASLTIRNTQADTAYMITYIPSDYTKNWTFRLSGFTFEANGKHILALGSQNKSAPFILQTNIRIDNNTFVNSTTTELSAQAIWIYNTYPLIDNNLFDKFYYPMKFDAAASYAVGHAWWSTSPQNIFTLGSVNFPYVEDNTFNMVSPTGAIDGSGGDNGLTDGQHAQRYVFRYNTINNYTASYSLWDLHGPQRIESGGGMAPEFGAEIYGNQITAANNNHQTLLSQRSGQTLVFNNNITSTSTASNKAYTTSGGLDECPADPALKITHDSFWWGSRRNLTGLLTSSTASGGLDCNGLEDIPTLGRDIMTEASSPLSVSCGTLAAIPGTCTVGQGYWATNQSCSNLTGMVGAHPSTPISGTLYKCTATNTWTEFYTPYAYPHPLRGETVATNYSISGGTISGGSIH
jgi:hypothetical protein